MVAESHKMAVKTQGRTRELRGGDLRVGYSVQRDELDGGYIAECTDLPGCMSQGETEEEAVANLADAVADYISVVIEDHLQKQHALSVTNEAKETLVVKPLVALGFCAG
jgi:predicted RNase H-like HicB family nuclease